ncbi:MAG: hypothetical protein AB7U95_37900, partial [Reyranella sp.]
VAPRLQWARRRVASYSAKIANAYQRHAGASDSDIAAEQVQVAQAYFICRARHNAPAGWVGRLPPAVFGATRRPEEQRGGTLRSIGGFAPHPAAPSTTRAKAEQTQSADV